MFIYNELLIFSALVGIYIYMFYCFLSVSVPFYCVIYYIVLATVPFYKGMSMLINLLV